MPALSLPRPGISLGIYPENKNRRPPARQSVFARKSSRQQRKLLHRAVSDIGEIGTKYGEASDTELDRAIFQCQMALQKRGLEYAVVIDTYALIRELSHRILGMRHHDVQLMGAWAMLHDMVVEMDTGEGKTLTAVLAAGTAALAGIPTHVLTSNDYLAQRDAELMAPLYQRLGLTVGTATERENDEERKTAYRCDITYCTSKQVAFDYLRDKLTLKVQGIQLYRQLTQLPASYQPGQELFLRGLCYAIVDEADSVLADEAMNPMVIASEEHNPEQEKIYQQALDVVRSLEPKTDFTLDKDARQATLTETGRQKIQFLTQSFDGIWKGEQRRHFLIQQGIAAVYLFEKDKHYLVEDEKIKIIDQNTGRLMQDRSWEMGLHQLLECKEGCPMTSQRKTLAKITFQRFFRKYLKLAGMSGTVMELKKELHDIYCLDVIRIPTHKPSRRQAFPTLVFATNKAKWTSCIYRVKQLHKMKRPVLIGARTVKESDSISRLLKQHNLPHQVLNAKNTAQEAEIIAKAGIAGSITVATNVAGRGTDIKLDKLAKENGGLHVIVVAQNDAWRIDRQLIGRCARQGDPGSYELMFSLEEQTVESFYPATLRRFAADRFANNGLLPLWFGGRFIRLPQQVMEKKHRKTRYGLLKADLKMDEILSFSGGQE